MYDSPNNGMIPVTTQNYCIMEIVCVTGCFVQSVRKRVIPLLQSREIYSEIGENGLEGLHFFTKTDSKVIAYGFLL